MTTDNKKPTSQKTDPNNANDNDKKRRKRKRRRRILLAFLVIIGLGVGYWFYQTIKWERAIQAQLAEYRDAGQPVDLENFDPPAIPDSDNAARAYSNAATALTLTPEQRDQMFGPSPIPVAANQTVMLQAIADNTKTLQLVLEARTMHGVDWGYRMRSPLFDQPFKSWAETRTLAKFLGSLADHYHHVGNDAAAIETVRDIIKLGLTIRKTPTLIASLVAMATDSIACGTLEDITHNLKISSSPASETAHPQPASRAAVESFIQDLLDERELQSVTARTFYGERAYSLDCCNLVVNGKITPDDYLGRLSPSSPIIKILDYVRIKAFLPKLNRDTLRILQDLTALAEAAQKSNWPQAKEFVPPASDQGILDILSFPIRESDTEIFSRFLTLHFRLVAQRRMAAIALAMRLYEIDHHRRPAKLTELVPKYLPAIPVDPFSPASQPIGYRPDLPRPILYCASLEGADYYKTCTTLPAETDGLESWEKYGTLFFLNGDRPKPDEPTTTQPQ